MRLILPCRRAAVYDDVQIVASGHMPDSIRESHRNAEEVHANLFRNIEQRFVMFSRDDEHVPIVHRLDIHEGDSVRIFMADRYFGCTMNQVAECAMTR